MTGLTRLLYVIDGNDISPMRVDISDPSQITPKGFCCTHKIDWPDGAYNGTGYGIDAVQALSLTLNMIAIRLYASDLHKQKTLYWQKIGDGYGFPLCQGVKDLAEGADRSL